ncbi:MAG: hypothetical protein HY982_01555 [Candidatus Magasanikbacteria bacterium]|nr:hypothetical protein [Candidatus Magasanikbacteria bacterium]
MKNYSRKKSTPNKVAYRSSSRFRVNKNIGVREEKAAYCRGGIKGRPIY